MESTLLEAEAAPKIQAKACVVVVGTGRSGTSLAAQLLNELGVSLEKSLDAAGEQNPTGFAEDAFIVGMNRKLKGILTPGQQLPPDLEAAEAQIRPVEEELAAYIARNVGANALWGFKDPRTALYLPLYRRIFNKLRLAPKYVLCLRDPAETVASFVSHYRTDPDLAQLTWFSKNLAVLRESGLNCFILHYEKLLEDPIGQARKLADFVHDGGERPALDEAAILRTVQPNLNRSGAMPARITNPLVERLYDGLRTCEGADFDRTQLRLLVKDLSAIEQAFLPWAHVRTRAAKSGEQRKADEAKLQLAEAAKELKAANRQLAQDNARLTAERQQLAEAAKELKAANRQLAQDNARLAAERADARLLAEDHQRRTVDAEDRLAAERKKLSAAEGKCAEAERKRAETERKRAETERKRAETERKRAETEAARLDKLRQVEWKRMKAEPAYRLGRLIMEAYGRPLAKGLRLPAALLALRADNRRRRAAKKAPPASGEKKKK